MLRLPKNATVFEQDVPSARPVDSAEKIEQRRLSRAVRPDQPDDVSARNVERDVLQCGDPAELDSDVSHHKQRLFPPCFRPRERRLVRHPITWRPQHRFVTSVATSPAIVREIERPPRHLYAALGEQMTRSSFNPGERRSEGGGLRPSQLGPSYLRDTRCVESS